MLLIKPDHKIVVGCCLRRVGGRTAISLPWVSPKGRRLLLRLDLRRNLKRTAETKSMIFMDWTDEDAMREEENAK